MHEPRGTRLRRNQYQQAYEQRPPPFAQSVHLDLTRAASSRSTPQNSRRVGVKLVASRSALPVRKLWPSEQYGASGSNEFGLAGGPECRRRPSNAEQTSILRNR